MRHVTDTTGDDKADSIERPAPDDQSASERKKRQEELLDEAVEESFPASDPATPKHIT